MELDYRETLMWLFEQLPMYQRVGKSAYKADLSTTDKLLKALGNPEKNFKAIHIAGTNGKGSVSHLLASILQEAGYKTGLYTSPHLKDFRERIKINGQLIPESEVISFVEKNKSLFGSLSASFFEMTVGLAFDYFSRESVDFAVIETGMGGRLDSTNRCHPVISVITNIGLDHVQFLGETKELIAKEKAGIIKPHTPIIIGKHQTETDTVFKEIAVSMNAPIWFAEDETDVRTVNTGNLTHLTCDIWHQNQLLIKGVEFPLAGHYQIENLKTVIQTIETLKKNNQIVIDNGQLAEGIEQVIQNTGLQGRWQTLSNFPLTIADTGHNVDGIKAIVEQLSTLSYNKLHFVYGMVGDKDSFSILQLLPKNAIYYFCRPDIPRGKDVEELSDEAFKAGLNGKAYQSARSAYHAAQNNAGVQDLIFIGGSTFVVAELI